MRAIELKQGTLRLAERFQPEPGEGEARIRVTLAGICSTDLHLAAGYMEFEGVPGHEFVGVVEEAASAPELVGRTVTGEINCGCWKCDACLAGDPRHCADRTVLGIQGRDGAFAEQMVLPVANLHVLPAGLPPERAVFTEPVAAAFQILEQVNIKGVRALVLGCGRIGSLSAQVLRLGGAEVDVSDADPAASAALAKKGFRVAAEGRYDLVVEASGHPDGFPRALKLVRPRGTIVLKSTCASGRPLNLAPVVVNEITVIGSRCGRFDRAIEALARGDIRPEETIGGRFPLADFEKAFAAAANPPDPARRKILLTP